MAVRKITTAPPQETPVMPMDRTAQGLRDALFDEIDALRSGNGDRRRSMAVVAAAKAVLGTVQIEIDYQQHIALMSKTGDDAGKLGRLRLGKGG
jgi:hypothetical protein